MKKLHRSFCIHCDAWMYSAGRTAICLCGRKTEEVNFTALLEQRDLLLAACQALLALLEKHKDDAWWYTMGDYCRARAAIEKVEGDG